MKRLPHIAASLGATAAILLGPSAVAATAASPVPVGVINTAHPCTHTSSGTCIRGGEFCPQASYGHSGWDARGRRYVCKGNRVHPHWMIP